MKQHVVTLLTDALTALRADGTLPSDANPEIQVERARDRTHGDYAANTAMVLAKAAKRKPREIADAIVAALPASPWVASVEVAGPGFLNFRLTEEARLQPVERAMDDGELWGRAPADRKGNILLEFVSANPTGPLHVGHGRGAAFGDALANVLAAGGWRVTREYYVNDAGRQMDILAVSLWLRYAEACGHDVATVFPSKGYQGGYIAEHARDLHAQVGHRHAADPAGIAEGLPADSGDGAEAYLDGLIAGVKAAIGADSWSFVLDYALNAILDDIRADLDAFGVRFDRYFSERSVVSRIPEALERLSDDGHTYEADGALWFRSSAFGDDKDRVLRRENGQTTYFAADIAYHLDKVERGDHTLVDIWGADHHGYVPRVRAALEALGVPAERLEVHLVQFAVLWRHGEKVPMSTRSGEFVSLRELRDEVGRDAARFFYAMRRAEQHLDFDLDLAKSESNENPVYYCQYAHARIHSVHRQMQERGVAFDAASGRANLHRLQEDAEGLVIDLVGRYPEVIEIAATAREPHQLATYLRELSAAFHTYYNAVPFLVEDAALRNARVALIEAVRQTLANGLALLGVSAPERM